MADPYKKKALVLSGGGRLGAYQVGAVRALYQAGHKYRIFAGTSVGAINCGGLAQFEPSQSSHAIYWLENFWKTMTTDKVWKHWFAVKEFGALWKMAARDTRPLHLLLRRYFDVDKIRASKNHWLAGVVSLQDGEYRVFDIHHPDPVGICIASSAQPFFMLPYRVDVGGLGGKQLCLDGGVRGATPLRAAIYAGAEEIDVVLTEADHPRWHGDTFENALQVGLRALELMSHNIFDLDLELTLKENELVQAGLSEKRDIPINIYRPKNPLGGDPMDFHPQVSAELIEQGYEETQARLREQGG
jgi:NTE family protein